MTFSCRYEDIVKAIYKKAKEEKRNVRDFIREWIMLFEASRVVGFSRDEFLSCCVKESEKYKVNGGMVKRK